jgi:hypothetical protein
MQQLSHFSSHLSVDVEHEEGNREAADDPHYYQKNELSTVNLIGRMHHILHSIAAHIAHS